MAKQGRPTKYKKEFVEQVYKLALEGFTDERIASFFSIHVDTVYEWKNQYPEFSESLTRGKKDCAVGKIVPAMIKSACGFHEYDEVEEISPAANPETGKEKMRVVRRYKKYYPPNPKAGHLLVMNYAPDEFKDRRQMEISGKDGKPIQYELIDRYQLPKNAGT